MAPSGSLNPASVPFFPGNTSNGRTQDDDGAQGHSGLGYSPALTPSLSNQHKQLNYLAQQQQQQSSNNQQLHQLHRPSPPPIPPTSSSPAGAIRFQQSPPTMEWMRQSPLARSVDSDRSVYGFVQSSAQPSDAHLPPSLSNSALSHSPPSDDLHPVDGLPISSSASSTHSLTSAGPGPFRQSSTPMSIQQQNGHRASLANIHAQVGTSTNSPNPLGAISASPVSSLGSGSYFTTALDYPPASASSIGTSMSASASVGVSLDAQLRASPVVRDILDRLLRCEQVTRRITEDLFEVHRKVDLLVDRTLAAPLGAINEDFKDPFAPPGSNGALASARNSIAAGAGAGDDITQISQRLNTLTSSVGQLLALQTQQLGAGVGLGGVGINGHGGIPPPLDLAPNQLPPSQHRPSIGGGRAPVPPMRTWSVGNLEPPMRPSDMPLNNGPRGSVADIGKGRRSVSNNLMRRDSAGDLMMGRDGSSGPAVAKWEQLNLAPELLRSLTKFGVGPPNKIQQRALPFLLRGADIIAQAPPTQERIAAYVIPAIHVALVHAPAAPRPAMGPLVVMVSTTVDQATQAQRMIRDLGGPIGVRSALGVGASAEVTQEVRLLQQGMPHILCGTPQKLHALFTAPGGLSGAQVRLLVLDEVDQLIARNLHEFIFNIVKLLPPPRSRPISGGTVSASGSNSAEGRRFPSPIPPSADGTVVERQTALFSNTVPQDVLNLATAIQLREPVRVLVRRDGNVTHADAAQSARGLRQFYLYLAFTAGGARDPASGGGGGLGIIGSGRASGTGASAESVQAREWKLDALCDLFDDVEVGMAIVHVGGTAALDAVSYKLASRGLEAVPLHGDMNQSAKMGALNKFRGAPGPLGRPPAATRVLVVYDVQVKSPEVQHIPLVINYDLPKAVEEYAHRVAPAIAPPNAVRAGVVVNFVTATGGDVEMLRSIECFYKIKCPEVPMSLRDVV